MDWERLIPINEVTHNRPVLSLSCPIVSVEVRPGRVESSPAQSSALFIPTIFISSTYNS